MVNDLTLVSLASLDPKGSLEVLEALLNSYQLLALTDNTAKVYTQRAKTLFKFCMHYNLPSPAVTAESITEQWLLYFVAHCAHNMKLAASTINTYLYGIRDWCIGQGLPNPLKTTYGRPLLRLQRVLKGIKELHKETARLRLHVTLDIPRMLISFLSFGCFGQHDDLMLSAVCTLASMDFCGVVSLQ